MKNTSIKPIQSFLYALLCTALLIGCSTIGSFFDDSSEQLPAGAFRGTAAIRNQTLPLPVDIAENILAIENGQLITEDSPRAFQEEDGTDQRFHQGPRRPRFGGQNIPPHTHVVEHTHPFSGRKRWSSNSQHRVNSAESSKTGRRRAGTIHHFKKGKRTLQYQVKNGDTLMKIAFAKYGDIFRWRDIYRDNQDSIADYNNLIIGSTLVLNGVPFIVIERNGEPYLIRRGDTLVGISRKLYQSPRYWSNLWKNNTQLIQDPNKIYAGFKIYYRPKSEVVPAFRQPTSQSKQ